VIDTVPADTLSKSQQMLEVARAAERAAIQGQRAGVGSAAAEDELLLLQQLPSK
jgi:hypothetical protein